MRHWDDEMYDDDLIDGVGFADPGGNSALRASTRDNMTDYTLKNIDTDFWHRVKAHAALEGMSIKQFILNLLKNEIGKRDLGIIRKGEK